MLEEAVSRMLSWRSGAIEAPAGTGKTEQIAIAVSKLPGRWLILTHTVAGVEAIRRRLKGYGATEERVHVDTISAWAYRWARAYPSGSRLPREWSVKSADWSAVHVAATTLVVSGAISSVFAASYAGVFVDEYQDCSESQHNLVLALASVMRCYIFGDPLQAIFRFSKKDRLVDWAGVTLKQFPLAGRFETPHRWVQACNPELGRWLLASRPSFGQGVIDLSTAPDCVQWIQCAPGAYLQDLAKLCTAQRKKADESLVVLDASTNAVRRADLAKWMGGTTVEPVSGKCEREFYARLSVAKGFARVEALLDLSSTVFAGASAADKKKRVESILLRPGKQKNSPSPAELALCAVAQADAHLDVVQALDCLEREEQVKVVRPELLYSVRSTLRAAAEDPTISLDDAAWQTATLKRLRGRVVRDRSVGSTLLVKGLEFDHVVITPEACTSRFDWYVALTRATKSIRVLAPNQVFNVR